VALKTIRRHLMDSATAASRWRPAFVTRPKPPVGSRTRASWASYDYGDEGDIAYIAMEFVEGSSLSRVLGADTRFAEDDTLSLMAQLLDALEHAMAMASGTATSSRAICCSRKTGA